MSRDFSASPDQLIPVQRVSGLAVASLVFALLCCIPGSGMIGVVLGGAGLIGIARSGGRLSGRGLAMVGVVLGLLGTVLWTGGILGTLYSLNQLTVYERVVEAAQRGDHGGVRGMLSPDTSAAVTDAQIDEFGRRVEESWGRATGVPQGLPDWLVSYPPVVERLGRAGVSVQRGTGVLPLPLKAAKGSVPAVFMLDPRHPAPAGMASLSNLGVVGRDGAMIWLRDPGASAAPPPSPAPPAPPSSPSRAPGG